MLLIIAIVILALMVLVLGYFVVANAKCTAALQAEVQQQGKVVFSDASVDYREEIMSLGLTLNKVASVQHELDDAQARMDETIREIDQELSHVKRILSEIDHYLKAINLQKGRN